MKITIFFICALTLCATDFWTFEKEALQKSLILRAQNISKQQVAIQAKKALRAKNPEILLYGSSYEKETSGFGAEIDIPVRFDRVLDAKRDYFLAKKRVVHTKIQKRKAQFVKALEKAYSDYILQKKVLLLQKERLKLNKNLLSIAKAKFAKGIGKKVDVLRFSLLVQESLKGVLAQRRRTQKSYIQIFEIAGFKKDFRANDFLYSIKVAKSAPLSPEEEALEAQKTLFFKEAKMRAFALEEVRLYGEYEKEPSQYILRAGIKLDLPLFNRKREERKLALLKAKKMATLLDYQKRQDRLKKKELQNSLRSLKQELIFIKKLIAEEKRVLAIYTKGYAIDKSSLLELIDTQKRLIGLKHMKIRLLYEANKNIIEQNYIQGVYRD